MPSGPKKRKAAKKKQVKEAANSTISTHSHGDDDLKNHDEGEEVEVEKTEDSSSIQSFASENQSTQVEITQKADKEEEGNVQIDRVLKSENYLESNNIYIQSTKGSHDGSSSRSSSSSSSSSDDESRVIEKNSVVLETAPAVDLVEPVDSLPEEVTYVKDELVVEASPVVDSDNTMIGKADDIVVESPSVTDLDKVQLLEHTVLVNECSLIDNCSTSGVDESVLKENGETKLTSLDENTEVSPSYENTAASSEAKDYVAASTLLKGSVSEENEEKLLLSFNAPSNGSEQVKESDTPECSGSQPLLASSPRIAETTSWKSCCGILELFSGSNR